MKISGKKIRVALIFGGRSAEHEVSIRSAQNVAAALDPQKYEVSLIGITPSGKWLPAQKIAELPSGESQTQELITLNSENKYDVVFPVLHGPYGEDGTIQGFLRLANVAFVGADVLGSAIGMDKDVSKRLLREAKIPVGPFLVSHAHAPLSWAAISKKLGTTLFIKPANLGSSVGVSKVRNKKEFAEATALAFSFDTKILIEKALTVREIEVAVLGNEKPIASLPGELVVKSEFYSYDAKYTDPDAMVPEIPAKLSKALTKTIQELAVRTYTTLCCEGMARVDFFLTKGGKIYVNEVNTIPGFSNISMYPQLFEASGISYSELLDKLISLAIEKHEKRARLSMKR